MKRHLHWSCHHMFYSHKERERERLSYTNHDVYSRSWSGRSSSIDFQQAGLDEEQKDLAQLLQTSHTFQTCPSASRLDPEAKPIVGWQWHEVTGRCQCDNWLIHFILFHTCRYRFVFRAKQWTGRWPSYVWLLWLEYIVLALFVLPSSRSVASAARPFAASARMALSASVRPVSTSRLRSGLLESRLEANRASRCLDLFIYLSLSRQVMHVMHGINLRLLICSSANLKCCKLQHSFSDPIPPSIKYHSVVHKIYQYCEHARKGVWGSRAFLPWDFYQSVGAPPSNPISNLHLQGAVRTLPCARWSVSSSGFAAFCRKWQCHYRHVQQSVGSMNCSGHLLHPVGHLHEHSHYAMRPPGLFLHW